ncbi:MFS transporter [Alkaliphilus serpentinus]|uniref:MFS transporter n=1 Tax=Alkaliphilus serpentinus TaxID=1482731 RepID=A0A833M882_9FIRM|nr:MFS transporter [Alkaliphilus serpentinus]KAB3530254.1 MFS transporter [Alkaliphilus serpentinus]
MKRLLGRLKADIGILPVNIKWIFAVVLLNNLGNGMISTLYNLYLQEIGFNKAFMGQLISMTALASAIFLVPVGFFSDRLGRKNIMMTGIFVTALCQIFRALFLSQGQLLLFSFTLGIFNSFFMVSNAPFLMENTTKENRIRIFSVNTALMIFSSMVGSIIGGSLPLLLIKLGVNTLDQSQRITLLIAASFSLLALIPMSKIKSKGSKKENQWPEFVKNITSKNNWRLMSKLIFSSGLVGFGAGLFVPFSNVYFENQFSLNSSTIGFIISAGQASTIIAVMMGPFLASKLGKVKTVFMLQILSIPFMIMLGDTSILWIAIIAFLIRQAIMNASGPISSTIMMEEVPENLKGLTNSLSQAVVQVGWAVCTRLSGIIIDGYGYEWIFYLAGTLYATSAIYYYFAFRGLDGRKSFVMKRAL